MESLGMWDLALNPLVPILCLGCGVLYCFICFHSPKSQSSDLRIESPSLSFSEYFIRIEPILELQCS